MNWNCIRFEIWKTLWLTQERSEKADHSLAQLSINWEMERNRFVSPKSKQHVGKTAATAVAAAAARAAHDGINRTTMARTLTGE